MKVPRIVARVNKYVTNPVQGLWASRLAPWAVVGHVGRRSGSDYQTPVLAWLAEGRVSIPIMYGPTSDWVRNVLAAGEFTLTRSGRTHRVAGARLLPADSPDVVRGARPAAFVADHVLYGRLVDED
ncbi:hypothetical protein [Gordonia shandongensis]|uniref:hypothetical protein n=1 Tax=Gordonia shandongensis TaxID=376351 RepID=UPI000418642D|nr:hypothetical protein [Gordonia shandongensis]